MKGTILIAFLCVLLAGSAGAQTVFPLNVSQVSLATTRDDTRVSYLTFEMPVIEVPDQMRFSEAYIEFYVDASNTRTADGIGETVTLEMYPYRGATDGKFDVAALGTSSMKRTVQVGEDRRVRLYVSDAVERAIKDPNGDRRYIVGSVSGDRRARFSAKSLPDAPASKALLTVYFSRIEDTRTGRLGTN